MDQFDTPFERTIYVEQKDYRDFQLAAADLSRAAHTMRNWNNQGDMITFTVQAQCDVFVMTPPVRIRVEWPEQRKGPEAVSCKLYLRRLSAAGRRASH